MGKPEGHEEYTFTDRELESILSFLEQQGKPGAKMEANNLPNIPPVFGQGSPTSLAQQLPMQFQPHSLAGNGSPPLTHNFVKAEPQQHMQSGPQVVQYNLVPHPSSGPQESIPQVTHMVPPAAVPVYHQSLSMRELYNPLPSPHAPAPAAVPVPAVSHIRHNSATSEKPQISHSTVEKQRRDRINNLIDELRELVPPQTPSNGGSENSDVKRAKHVVLSDTIALLKKLQAQMPLQMQSIANQQTFDEPMREDSADSRQQSLLGLQYRSQDGTKPTASKEKSQDLPMPPKNQNANGVVVEEAEEQEGLMIVKVNCKDRRGLLADVISSLKSLDLEIKTAAITTTSDGTVHDVFEVIPHPDVTAEDIQCHVHSCVYTRYNQNDKRLRGTSD